MDAWLCLTYEHYSCQSSQPPNQLGGIRQIHSCYHTLNSQCIVEGSSLFTVWARTYQACRQRGTRPYRSAKSGAPRSACTATSPCLVPPPPDITPQQSQSQSQSQSRCGHPKVTPQRVRALSSVLLDASTGHKRIGCRPRFSPQLAAPRCVEARAYPAWFKFTCTRPTVHRVACMLSAQQLMATCCLLIA
jgi:hypothetical protein